MGRSYMVNVLGWRYRRRISFKDGLISFQVTVCVDSCWTCKQRVRFVKERIDELNAVDVNFATSSDSILLDVRIRVFLHNF
jgi:hypothetical protein